MQMLFLDAADNVDQTDGNTQAHLTAILYELRRLAGRYGATSVRTSGQAAAAAFNADSNNVAGATDAPTLVGLFGPASVAFTNTAPTHATHATGTPIVVTGTGFVQGTAVYIGGEACTAVVVNSGTTIHCTTPADLAAGTYDVAVVAPNGAVAFGVGAWTSD